MILHLSQFSTSIILALIGNFACWTSFSEFYIKNLGKYFTRNRKLTFKEVINILFLLGEKVLPKIFEKIFNKFNNSLKFSRKHRGRL